jgi:hypothetical protein
MASPERIRVFDSQGEDYKRAFQVFLDHTDSEAERQAVAAAGRGGFACSERLH